MTMTQDLDCERSPVNRVDSQSAATLRLHAQASVVARLATDATTAQILLARLGESFDDTHAVISAFEEQGAWQVAIHFREPPNETAVRALVALTAGPDAAGALAFERIADKDWVKASLEGLAPVAVGRFFIHGAHDRARVPANAIGVEIEAALAFGTGHHGTTQGCLRALARIAKACRPRDILDVGTGSGVLAIAAAQSLRARVLASDIDLRAVHAARSNARQNHAAPRIIFVHTPGLAAGVFRRHAPFDLVFANILLEPIKSFATPLARLLAPGARLVLSGLLTTQAQPALAAYLPHGLALESRIQLGGWTTLILRKRARDIAVRGARP
jgi:ribosomal protein L11 methyltransferase